MGRVLATITVTVVEHDNGQTEVRSSVVLDQPLHEMQGAMTREEMVIALGMRGRMDAYAAQYANFLRNPDQPLTAIGMLPK